MYEILQNPKRMSIQEIDDSFDGKWVYVVNCERNERYKTIAGVPVIIADGPFEGVEDGIYAPYDDESYGTKLSHTLLPSLNFFASFSRITRCTK
ncbi:MAG: hypothetical protein FWE90_10480 [Defluviitaleaceae bacterium]|nr:hypothetical protein [Defluviitaleaceae bacterium]